MIELFLSLKLLFSELQIYSFDICKQEQTNSDSDPKGSGRRDA